MGKRPGIGLFYLVESRNGPRDSQPFKMELANNESFETDFIGASEQDCREWALEQQFQNNMIEQDIIAIADQRSASDDALSIQFYRRNPGYDFGVDGILPREHDKWYEFRVIYKEANTVYAVLSHVEPDVGYPVYFGRKDELTDGRGIFDTAKANELIVSGIGT